ncbi:MAG: hypothetical protein Q7U38_03130 [Methylobacter sp.]|nr:hypothetical protein [Methylobacter sp.]MDP2429765.1 hypothetical protein [Methylobacter sp.]MDP3056567.1 hypothetical protein [Methylobacter sp.]MDP3364179.1 hypothetical protein [Methylobacter sp.]MDZ4217963.1 hypothetical protein [Methylobacter sp.]
MTIKFNPDSLTATVDYQTYCSLVHGTEFQQSMNMLAMLNQMLMDVHQSELEAMNLPAKEYQQALQNIDSAAKSILRLDPPPGIDPDALRIFCD